MSEKKTTELKDKLDSFKSKLLEDKKKLQENPENEIPETSLSRMNGPIGVELSEEELEVVKTDNIVKKVF